MKTAVVVGLSRRRGEERERVRYLPVDLLDPADAGRKLRVLGDATHVFYCAFQAASGAAAADAVRLRARHPDEHRSRDRGLRRDLQGAGTAASLSRQARRLALCVPGDGVGAHGERRALGRDWDVMSSVTKSRQHGFHDVVDSEEMFVRLLARFRAERIVP
jgi:hypothetical protein